MRFFFVFSLLLLFSFQPAFSQSAYDPDDHYFIVPGTMSYRTNGTNGLPLMHEDTLVRGTYYGADNSNSGAMTGWDSEIYKDFSFFRHPTDPNFITTPSDVDVFPENKWNKWMFNFRMAYPTELIDTADFTKLYPLIIMMHGKGERGNCWNNSCYGEGDPRMWNNDHNTLHGGNQHKQAILRDPSDPRHWPGFVIFPQNKNGYNAGATTYTDRVIAFVEQVSKFWPVDPNRIYIHGLSNGGEATWMTLNTRPDLFAAAAPMSGFRNNTAYDNNDIVEMEETMIHIPLRQFQGGRDGNPKPANTEQKMTNLINLGGTPEYYLYPNLGHGTWNTAYNEPDFFSWFLQFSKLTIHSYYGQTEICEGDQAKLGISPGFTDYEWRKVVDGVTTTVTPISGTPNEIIADEAGDYSVRFARGTEWTEWSDPYTITGRVRESIPIVALNSTALPGLDGSTETTLEGPYGEGQLYFEWFKDGVTYAEDSTLFQISVTDPGNYSLIVTDAGLCESLLSNVITVSIAPYGPSIPSAPGNLSAMTNDERSINLFWNDNSTNETGFEIYRSTSMGGPYTFISSVPEGTIQFTDEGLIPATSYFYIIRAFNGDGPSAASSEATANTAADNEAPTSPQNFVFEKFDYTTYEVPLVPADPEFVDQHFEINLDRAILSWNSSDDNIAISEYEVYFSGGTLAGTTSDTSIVIPGLDEEETYSFYVVAKDLNDNYSNPSNEATVTTTVSGLYFNLYGGGTWDYTHEYSRWALFTSGFYNNFDWRAKNYATPAYTSDDYFGYDFFGYIYIEENGTYDYRVRSDDGSQLWIGSTMVVDNDGLHGCNWGYGSIALTPGYYPITVKMFERSGGQCLDVEWRPPSAGSYVNIPNNVLRSSDIPSPTPPAAPTNLAATADGSLFQIDVDWDYTNDYTVVVLGSSTANGVGASTPADSWVGQLDTWLASHTDTYTLHNLAVNGYNTYHIREDGTTGYTGAPDVNANITEAISLNPDIIIVNMPSNNVAENIDVATTISHYDEIKALADLNGIKIFFTTTQPRDFNSNSTKRHLLEDEANAVRDNYGAFVIDIYDELTDFADDNRIKAIYEFGDGTHLNDAGHSYIFSEVLATVGPHFVKTEVYRSLSSGGTYDIIHTTDYGAKSFTDIGLEASTEYFYKVKAVNIDGQSALTNHASTTTAADVDAPSVPTALVLQSYTHESVAFTWTASTDNVEVTEYLIYESGSEVGSTGSRTLATPVILASTASTAVTIGGLDPSTTYNFTVSAKDAAGNESPQSSPALQVTTLAGPLPVEFLNFSAKVVNNGIELIWTTASEINNDFFTIERSNNLSEFSILGNVQGAGNSEDLLRYSFRDTQPIDIAYYRIKQTDFDGQTDYSKTVMVKYDLPKTLVLYPNPTESGNINIRGNVVSTFAKANIQIIDPYGKVHYESQVDTDALENGVKLKPNGIMKTGIYIIVINDGSKISRKKLIIK